MSETELHHRFSRFRDHEAECTLLDAALCVVVAVRGAVDADAVEAALERVAGEAASRTVDAEPFEVRVAELCAWLGGAGGFGGSRQYHETANSLIDEVLKTGRGIPITLAIVYAEVAQRLGLHCVGVNFPGHFLVRCAERPDDQSGGGVLVDPFAMRVVDRVEIEGLLQRTQGSSARLQATHLASATPRTVLVRMLNNLKQLAIAQERLQDALRFSDLILVAAPELVFERSDRAKLFELRGDVDQALVELQLLDACIEDGVLKERLEAEMTRLARKASSGRIVH